MSKMISRRTRHKLVVFTQVAAVVLGFAIFIGGLAWLIVSDEKELNRRDEFKDSCTLRGYDWEYAASDSNIFCINQDGKVVDQYAK